MTPQSHHLLTRRPVRDLERATVGGAPDRLHHVAEVVARQAKLQEVIAHDEEQRERPHEHRHTKTDRPDVLPRERLAPRVRKCSGCRRRANAHHDATLR